MLLRALNQIQTSAHVQNERVLWFYRFFSLRLENHRENREWNTCQTDSTNKRGKRNPTTLTTRVRKSTECRTRRSYGTYRAACGCPRRRQSRCRVRFGGHRGDTFRFSGRKKYRDDGDRERTPRRRGTETS